MTLSLMNIIRQIFIILLFYILGELASLGLRAILPSFYLPGTILGMILLLALLIYPPTKKYLALEEVGGFLSQNMAFFFIPAAVSVMEYLDLLQATFFTILLFIILSSLLSFLAVALSVQLVLYLQNQMRKARK